MKIPFLFSHGDVMQGWRGTYSVPSLLRRKTISVDENALNRCLGVYHLLGYGIAATVGAGIFVVTGLVARSDTGPALVFSFLLAGIACLMSGLCYSEFSTRIPLAGSAYTFAYASAGELVGWL